MSRGRQDKFEWTPHKEKMVRYRLAEGESYTAIARELGIHLETLRRYLSGKPRVAYRHGRKIND